MKKEAIREKFHKRIDENAFYGITGSCTLAELEHPASILANGSRLRRIAFGSGRKIGEVRVMFKALVASGVTMGPDVFYEMKEEKRAEECVSILNEAGVDMTVGRLLHMASKISRELVEEKAGEHRVTVEEITESCLRLHAEDKLHPSIYEPDQED